MKKHYLFDTHALIFWSAKEFVSDEFIEFFDEQMNQGYVLVSSISFWETALLAKKGKIQIGNVHEWKSGLSENTRIRIINPTAFSRSQAPAWERTCRGSPGFP